MSDSLLFRLRNFKPISVQRWPGNDGEDHIPNIQEATALIEECLRAFETYPNRVDCPDAEIIMK